MRDGTIVTGRARAELRAATAEMHERLHHLPAFARLLDGSLDRGGYRALLARLHGLHAPLEEALLGAAEALAAAGVDLRNRRRVPALARDLLRLGLDRRAVDALPRSAGVAVPPGVPGLLGVLYVREGSTLGGAVLARAAAPLFPGETPPPTEFLAGDEATRGASWRLFCAALERACVEDGALQRIIEAARLTFGAFEAWLAPEPAWTP